MSNTKRYIWVMIISVILNTVFYLIAHFMHLPVWLDMTGTAMAALILEPAAGLLVGLMNNFLEAIFFYDAASLIYFAVSASVALIIGLMIKDKTEKITFTRVIVCLLLVLVATTLISTAISYIHGNGVPDSNWENYFFNQALNHGVPKVLATMYGIGVLKVGDILVSSGLILITYLLLPKKLKYNLEKQQD